MILNVCCRGLNCGCFLGRLRFCKCVHSIPSLWRLDTIHHGLDITTSNSLRPQKYLTWKLTMNTFTRKHEFLAIIGHPVVLSRSQTTFLGRALLGSVNGFTLQRHTQTLNMALNVHNVKPYIYIFETPTDPALKLLFPLCPFPTCWGFLGAYSKATLIMLVGPPITSPCSEP